MSNVLNLLIYCSDISIHSKIRRGSSLSATALGDLTFNQIWLISVSGHFRILALSGSGQVMDHLILIFQNYHVGLGLVPG